MKTFLTLLLSIVSLTAYCYDVEVDGIFYNEISFLGRKVTVTASPDEKKYSGDIIIPSEVVIDGMTFIVVEIEPDAFKDCTNINSISVGSNIVTIGARAFKNCSNLKFISIGPNVETIGLDAFNSCTSLSILSFEDGNSVLYINPKDCEDTGNPGRGAFYDCPIDSIYFGRELAYDGATNGASAPFYDAKTIRSVKFGNCINEIGGGLLSTCSNLKNVDLGCNVKIINVGAFSSIGAEEIILPESIDSIGRNAFSLCKNLKNVISLRKDPQPIDIYSFEFAGRQKEILHMTLFYPAGCRTKYTKTEGWNRFRQFKEIAPSQLYFEAQDTTIFVGDTIRTKVDVSPYYAELTYVEWSSSNENVAIVDSTGFITALSPGNAIISVKIPETNVYAELKVEVLPILVTSISLNESLINLSFGEQYQFEPIILPENSTNKNLKWYSSNDAAVTISNSGLATRVGSGRCIIMAMTLDGTNLVAICEIEDPADGISERSETLDVQKIYYSVNGTKSIRTFKGINIVKNANGQTFKILAK